MTSSHAARDIDTSRPHSARMYDYYLGGKDHFEVDKQAAEAVAEAYPAIFVCARENRAFMHRATRVLAREHGIRQWLDIGTGIPTEPNLHQVAQSVVPEARVVYADNDPLVLKYAERLMRSTTQGRTTYIEADVNDPSSLLDSAELAEVLDLDRPVALSLNALMHFVPDAQDPYGIVERLLAVLPSGSALALSHCTPDFDPDTWQKVTDIYTNAGTPVQFRSKQDVARFFDGLDLLDPGISVGHRWRPDGESNATDAEVSLWTGVGIKP
ncbi:SAM-dependent methyltransferase [Streptomyces spinosirectus]|uniref:SAM-dependent methyltransferase n=1 Tax=Streptomyces TaxID=1883 RepID=UPI000D3A1098|nr:MULTISPECIES: SAM-dependent methyltransferase [Streptomyces]MBY8341489.1 SAM-dependent methyltransferase [Streptomyces plumbidurans]PTM96627.1 S-adenosyl methyltransferase [Streptomyces sp. VMFN-G11Ma]UIR16206.1 SAM-dependent methyltransferase [Streptomyces spinosirectus]